MAWAPDYCTTAELKSFLRITDTADDAELGFAITAASKAIDRVANRQFGVTTAEARQYSWCGEYIYGRPALKVDDIMTTTGLIVKVDLTNDGVYEQTLTLTTDYVMYPRNNPDKSLPWTHILLTPTAVAYFPAFEAGTEVTAAYGWTTVPTTIKDACLLQASRFFSRRNSPYGIAGSPEFGTELRLLERLDPDVRLMVLTYKRQWGAVGYVS